MRKLKVVLVDDEENVLRSLRRVLRKLNTDIFTFQSPTSAFQEIEQIHPDLVISDHRMPEMTGCTLLSKIKDKGLKARRVVLSGYADFDEVTQAFNEQVIHQFIAKPWENSDIEALVKSMESPDQQEAVSFNGMVSWCPEMKTVFEKIKRVSKTDAPIFINGESGTGKELVARALHAESDRSDEPFYAFNCANFNGTLMESQLFGHKREAFTNAYADQAGILQKVGKGTLFLDETTTLSFELQAKLLRVLQEKEFSLLGGHDVIPFEGRVITASSTSLDEAVAKGDFRKDLRYRMQVIAVDLPPLKDRGVDRVNLLLDFLRRFDAERDWLLTDQAKEEINKYSWPGNVREMENVAQYMCAMLDNGVVAGDVLTDLFSRTNGSEKTEDYIHSDSLRNQSVQHELKPAAQQKDFVFTRENVEKLLEDCAHNKTMAAKKIGVSRMTLWRKIRALETEQVGS